MHKDEAVFRQSNATYPHWVKKRRRIAGRELLCTKKCDSHGICGCGKQLEMAFWLHQDPERSALPAPSQASPPRIRRAEIRQVVGNARYHRLRVLLCIEHNSDEWELHMRASTHRNPMPLSTVARKHVQEPLTTVSFRRLIISNKDSPEDSSGSWTI